MPVPAFSPMVGTAVAANFEFFDDLGEPADPTTVTISTRDPSGDVEVIVPTHSGTGIYRAEFTVTAAGAWVVQARGEGAVDVVEEATFWVRPNVIPLD